MLTRHLMVAAAAAILASVMASPSDARPQIKQGGYQDVSRTDERDDRYPQRVYHTEKPTSAGVAANGIVAEARAHLGATAAELGLRRNLWCGAFVDMVLRRTGHAGGGARSLRGPAGR